MEAFDQPWKAYMEGAVGSYWGVYDVNRHPKFAFTAPIVRVPEWHILAAISVAVSLLLLGLLYLNSDALRNRGRSFLALVVYAAATIAVWVIYDFTQQYMTVSSVIAGVLLLLGMLGVLLVLLAEAHEWAEAHWVEYRRRLGAPQLAHTARPPKVSIHVPAYNEPPDMLIETLDALARLDYPDFEVLVIDNNTRDEAVWRPVEAHCAALGARFRFFHVAPLAGFKAGALNYALARTAADAQIVAVIDSDYVVDAALAARPDAGVRGPARRHRAGAAGLPRRRPERLQGDVLRGVPRLLPHRHDHAQRAQRHHPARHHDHGAPRAAGALPLGRVVHHRGRRARAAHLRGGLRRHLRAGELRPRPHARYLHRLQEAALPLGLRGDADPQGARARRCSSRAVRCRPGSATTSSPAGCRGSPTAATCCSTSPLSAGRPRWCGRRPIDPPLVMYSVLPLSLFTFKLAKLVHLYRVRVGANLRQTLAAAIAGLALTHTIGKAAVKGLLTRSEPFFRTPKQGSTSGLLRALAAAREETLMMIGLMLSAWAVGHLVPTERPEQLRRVRTASPGSSCCWSSRCRTPPRSSCR